MRERHGGQHHTHVLTPHPLAVPEASKLTPGRVSGLLQLKITYSVHRDLIVKNQGDKSMDYTLAAAPPMQAPPMAMAPPMGQATVGQGPPAGENQDVVDACLFLGS